MRLAIKILTLVLVLAGLAAGGMAFLGPGRDSSVSKPGSSQKEVDPDATAPRDKKPPQKADGEQAKKASHPMAISSLRKRSYPGGEFTIQEELQNGSNYERYIASYESEGLDINGLLTVPLRERPADGFPAVIFLHGYIPPDQYSTTASYPTYQATLARAGFVTYKPDLRGHAESEGEPVSAHFSEKYVIDTLNAIAYLKEYPEVDPGRIAYWGHSNGGEIGLRAVLVDDDIRAASFWAGVVGSYEDMLETYNDDIPFLKDTDHELVKENGLPGENPDFWDKLDPYAYLEDISIPIQLQHATGDESVPVELSISLQKALEAEGKHVEYIEYQGDDHNISANADLAWQRTIEFFRKHLSESGQNDIALPLDRPEERITKKDFGMYITPEDSPIDNERFRGYHTGVDWEVFADELGEAVPVKAMCSGELVYRNDVSGYGGVAVQACELKGEPVTVLYGHLDLASIDFRKSDSIESGEVIGELGKHESAETAGERKHLHLGIHKGPEVELAGYVDAQDKLTAWLDPCQYVCD